ncbi:MerR family transcriptional regulator [Quatrionicoccus australiensis]|uniref:MerR family transcriptional regulator n=1 Tax=Quatrionicoccus australiensis TaxID=138118 RepID=UPI001CFABC73|nr:helix-turn-helix domain-containing protein [Quatrionicoccus australiensis]MCB4360579.1 helix-turn-helix domain-containing protein [Quatrionicoccus australiensis]
MTNKPAIPATCSTSEAAKILGISVRAAQLWVENGMLQAWKTPGGHRRILRSSLALIVEQQKMAADQGTGEALSILIIETAQSEREYLGEALLAAFPNSKIQLSATAFESLLSLGEKTPDVLIANLDTLDAVSLQQHDRASGTSLLAGTLLIALAPDHAAMAELRRQLPSEFILLGKPPAQDELQRLIRAFIQGRQNHRRKA